MAVVVATVSSPAAAAPPTIRDLVTMADISSVAVSPDGKYAVFRVDRASIDTNNHDLEWQIVPIDGSQPARRVAGAGGALWLDAGVLRADPPLWSRDSQWFYYRALVDGAVQVWRTRSDGSTTEQVTDDPANVEAFALVPGSDRLVYRVGATREAIVRAEQKEYDDGIRIDASVDVAANLFRSAQIDGRAATQRLTGFWFDRGGLLAGAPKHFETVNLATLKPITPSAGDSALVADPLKSFEPVGDRFLLARAVAADGKVASVLSDGATDLLTATSNVNDATATECRSSLCRGVTISAVQWRPVHDAVIFTVSDAFAAQSLYEWDLASGAVRRVARDRGLLNGGRDPNSSCALSATEAICVAASAAMPPRLVGIDLATGKRRLLLDPNPALSAKTPPERAVSWRDANGRRFTGQLFLPAGTSAPAPLFVTYYNCDGYLRGGTGDEWPLAPLAAHGIAALCINRAAVAPGYADAFGTYRTALDGVKSAIKTLADDRVADPAHVGMGGLSFGSEATMWIATHSSLLAALSVTSTLLEPAYYWFNGVAGRDTHTILKRSWELGAPDETPDRWQQLSPALNVGAIRVPVLMQMPEQEFRYNMELYSKLSQSRTPVDLYAFPDEPHIKIQPRHKLAAYSRNLDWFRYWLQGKIDPDPAKAEQYRRWAALKAKRE